MIKNCTAIRLAGWREEPRCSHGNCWDEFFRAHPGKLLGGRLALTEIGEEHVINAQVKAYQGSLPVELPGMRRQATRYVKALKKQIRWNKDLCQTPIA
jgi:hypothetical protein